MKKFTNFPEVKIGSKFNGIWCNSGHDVGIATVVNRTEFFADIKQEGYEAIYRLQMRYEEKEIVIGQEVDEIFGGMKDITKWVKTGRVQLWQYGNITWTLIE